MGKKKATPGGEGIREVAVAAIAANPNNPVDRTDHGLEGLVASVREVGVIQPLTVANCPSFSAAHPDLASLLPAEADFVVLDGHRRLAAAKQAGTHTVSVVVRDDLAGAADQVMVTTSRHRLALTPIQEAQVFARQLTKPDMTQRRLAELVGVSHGQIAKRIALLKLPPIFQSAIEVGLYKVSEAQQVLAEDENVRAAVGRVLEGRWTQTPHPPEDIDKDEQWLSDNKEWGLGIDIVLRQAHDLVGAEEVKQIAATEGVDYVDDIRERLHNPWNHHLYDKEEIAQAKADGTLVITHGGNGRAQYYTLTKQRRKKTPYEVQQKELAATLKAAAKTREPFVEMLSETKPTSEQRQHALLALAFGRVGGIREAWNTTTLPGINDSWDLRSAVKDMTLKEQTMFAWRFYVAAMAQTLKTENNLDPSERYWFLTQLQTLGYVPHPHDQTKIDTYQAERDAKANPDG